jgi:hypothetical protein
MSPPSSEHDSSTIPAPFRYTFDDFRQAHVVVEQRSRRLAAAAAERTARAAPNARKALVPLPRRQQVKRCALAAVVALIVFLFVQFRERLVPTFMNPREDEYFLLRLLFPIALFIVNALVLAWLVRRARLGGTAASSPTTQRRAQIIQIAGGGFALVVIGSALVFNAVANRTLPLLLHELVLMTAPWVAIFIGLFFLFVAPLGRNGGPLKARWDGSTVFHLDKFIALDETTFRLWDAKARYELRWDGLDGCEEGDDLFALIMDEVFYMLPKRVMTPEQVVWLRWRFAPAAPTRTGGFPVLPARTSR